jgi:hypothetical protein
MELKMKGRPPTPDLKLQTCEPRRQRFNDRGATVTDTFRRVRTRSQSAEEAESRP